MSEACRLRGKLELAKDIVGICLIELTKLSANSSVNRLVKQDRSREFKSRVDRLIESLILDQLLPTGFKVITEETGTYDAVVDDECYWVVDPLDGTVNYIRKLGSSGISIALWRGNEPLFGVIGVYPTMEIAWGGKSFGSFIGDTVLQVSRVSERALGVICTGFPSNFNFSKIDQSSLINNYKDFGKVRMLGAASISLLQVAKGSAEYYEEQNIMIWDVAAGLALVEGAGGEFNITPGDLEFSVNVSASNGRIELDENDPI